jgi:hypothetical protein
MKRERVVNDKVRNLINDIAKNRSNLGHKPSDVNTLMMMYFNEKTYLKAMSISFKVSAMGYIDLQDFRLQLIQKMGLIYWHKIRLCAILDSGKRK